MCDVSTTKVVKLGAMMAASFVLAACGGGGGESGGTGAILGSTNPTVATGYFKDSNVAGLTFSSGGQSGTTDANGKFTYEVGKQVTFKVGGVTLGTVMGKSVVTPVDLVSNGSGSTVAVQNLVRFLMMLDADSNPNNGITISSAVQTRAANWSAVDWSTTNLDTALAGIIADTQAADSGVHVLPTASVATTHLSQTVYCIYSGGFSGTFSGSASGNFGMLIDKNGVVFGIGYVPATQGAFFASGTVPLSVDQQAAFVAGTTSSGASFSGSFSTPDDMKGTWSDTVTTSNGSFSGKRVAGAVDAVYRFTGLYGSQSGSQDVGFFAFDIDAGDHVSGKGYSIVDNQVFTASGSVSGTAFNATTSTNATITGTLDKQSGLVNGTYSGANSAGGFGGSGCKLN